LKVGRTEEENKGIFIKKKGEIGVYFYSVGREGGCGELGEGLICPLCHNELFVFNYGNLILWLIPVLGFMILGKYLGFKERSWIRYF
jgi:cytochrome c-type biogenesis protein CcmH/NrfF